MRTWKRDELLGPLEEDQQAKDEIKCHGETISFNTECVVNTLQSLRELL